MIAAGDSFRDWASLNDTIMGGSSRAGCRFSDQGLVLEGEVVSEGGGFVSCRSPVFRPPLDLSSYRGLRLRLDGQGRSFKFAVACRDGVFGLTELIPGGLRWVTTVATELTDTTIVDLPFDLLRPVVRAKPVSLPVRFDPSCITRLQLLHSRFGDDGEPNPGYRAGEIKLLIRSIEAF
ncbi:Complex I intermediate-associated protein 30 (CIA30) [Synechococcus sp. MIT S9509]|nr:Complex I intermediate-associated protein 30 (CIA30) [Synechococcus sp. MIT S9504]KZR93326.1 Complex I intermediate-associated protein 30 (CIA30) [Synechococcus sp. MIT S9509]